METFKAVIKKFEKQGEKTGWTYIHITEEQAHRINPGVRKEFKVKGRLDGYKVEQKSVLPMGDGSFIMPLNADMRKALGKRPGDSLNVSLQLDKAPVLIDADFLECLQDEPAALQTFQALTKGHQHYFSKWIQTAKTTSTKTKRIAMAVTALAKGWGFPEMLRAGKKEKPATGG